ncbi:MULTISPECIES: hypothetical protein [unclassified Variovorax]|uniref:hypothetical protein n=1 Tax=unclassified Variovorax TaxID=663243 RepID=UPI00076D4B3C|nr:MULTISPECIES: hypothetical protein [unclassified Variovorax]KWT97917.1 hypothetical protein APY03_1057 [Variovorax sp. WDL1]PNG59245.1 hypothetical protein CHC07_00971 [Variovorax sp. B4]PNG60964.1 hypothetical protein CHC06_00864 [Variovorax sp. B2]VTV13101.1 hypothetical protein WDL1CHR_03800 [Variovorax sp. WDL1]
MSTQNISTAAVHVIGQYNDAGKTLVGAYRAGVHRLLNGAASRTSGFLDARQLPLVSETLKARLVGAQEKVNGFLANRLDVDTGRVVAVMDRIAGTTTGGIESVANAAGRIESPLGNSVLQALGNLHQPVAAVSVQIADRIAAGAKQIESRVAGTSGEAAAVKTVKAKARTAVRRPARAARKAA